jgi:ferredoxin
MVLIGDIVGDDADAVAAATSEVVRLANARSGEGFVAVSARGAQEVLARPRAHRRDREAHQRVQDQRGRRDPARRGWGSTPTASSASTSSSPRSNKLRLLDELEAFLAAGNLPLGKTDDGDPDALPRARCSGDRVDQALELLRAGARALGLRAREPRRARWKCAPRLLELGYERLQPSSRARLAQNPELRVFDLLQDHGIRVSWKRELLEPLAQLFAGALAPTLASARDPPARAARAGCSSRCTCTPATATCTRTSRSTPTTTGCCRRPTPRSRGSCAIARELDGVISGEHGIGITKLEFLTDEETAASALQAARRCARPVQRRQALPGGDLRNAYTPSFGLMGYESLIMQQSDIGSIADSIKDCLRCGKCKPVCATHVPRANLLYSPRNKILATSLLIEAFLYEEQTRRGVSIRHWDEFGDVADHCTICHKCESAVPGRHRLRRRLDGDADLLRRMGKKRFNAGAKARRCCSSTRTNPRRSSSRAR